MFGLFLWSTGINGHGYGSRLSRVIYGILCTTLTTFPGGRSRDHPTAWFVQGIKSWCQFDFNVYDMLFKCHYCIICYTKDFRCMCVWYGGVVYGQMWNVIVLYCPVCEEGDCGIGWGSFDYVFSELVIQYVEVGLVEVRGCCWYSCTD